MWLMKESSCGSERDGLLLPLWQGGRRAAVHVESGSAEPCPAGQYEGVAQDFCNTLPQLLFPNSASPHSHRYSPLGGRAVASFIYLFFQNTDLFSLLLHEQKAENANFKLQDIVNLLHGVRIAASMDTVNKSFNFSVVSNIGTHSRELGNQLYWGSTLSNKMNKKRKIARINLKGPFQHYLPSPLNQDWQTFLKNDTCFWVINI